jgi:diguanylate cyclase (GGDEF)-like protein
MRRSDDSRRKGAPRGEPASGGKGSTSAGDQTLVVRTGGAEVTQQAPVHPGLVVIQGVEIGRQYRLRRAEMIVGRDEAAHLRIPDERISRRHALLKLDQDHRRKSHRVQIQDLGSTNGTLVNGEPVDLVELHDGDKILLGDTVLKFVLQDDLDARFHREIRNRIAYDQLTGLLTKESLYLAMESELRRCRRFDLPMTVFMMDLDRFKSVNDGHGHLMGSHVLAEVGRLIREAIRSTDVAARYGGEEFLAYLSEVEVEKGLEIAERIRGTIEGHTFTRVDDDGNRDTLRISISLGVSAFPLHGRSLESLVAAADAALYRAKESGRNRVCAA